MRHLRIKHRITYTYIRDIGRVDKWVDIKQTRSLNPFAVAQFQISEVLQRSAHSEIWKPVVIVILKIKGDVRVRAP